MPLPPNYPTALAVTKLHVPSNPTSHPTLTCNIDPVLPPVDVPSQINMHDDYPLNYYRTRMADYQAEAYHASGRCTVRIMQQLLAEKLPRPPTAPELARALTEDNAMAGSRRAFNVEFIQLQREILENIQAELHQLKTLVRTPAPTSRVESITENRMLRERNIQLAKDNTVLNEELHVCKIDIEQKNERIDELKQLLDQQQEAHVHDLHKLQRLLKERNDHDKSCPLFLRQAETPQQMETDLVSETGAQAAAGTAV
ncbi:hypothetical protein SELMODRAFT_426499 [Selaginella moellendorffii]|uniref:Uncharacterized protein n=1 Tax=Selaginella moellendorffii TaxID=88036 RepID=D8SWJ9_SELML|nr:hypothetical protein SELMODRAFT_426499 [Selaginella moellendorffii]